MTELPWQIMEEEIKRQRSEHAREMYPVSTEASPFPKAARNVLVKGTNITENLCGSPL